MRRLAAALLGLLLSVPLAAQQAGVSARPSSREASAAQPATPWTFGWVVDATFEFGGDEVAEVFFTSGDSQKITAGNGGTFSAGFELHPRATPKLGLRTLVGWKFSTSAAENVNIMFTRFPIEAVASYSLNSDWRVGAGVTHHAGINLDFDGLASNVAFDPATGATLEFAWKWAALTYTAMNYRAEDGTEFGANAIGVSVSYVFGKR